MKEKIISDIFKSQWLKSTLSKITCDSDLKDDLLQELMVVLLEMPGDKIVESYESNWIRYLVVNILKKMYHSSTSPFHKKFRTNRIIDINSVLNSSQVDIAKMVDFNELFSDTTPDYKLLEQVFDILYNDTNISWYKRGLFEMYYKIGRWHRDLGDLRDESCRKPTSSFRKMEDQLSIVCKGPNGELRRLKTDHSNIARHVKWVEDYIKLKIRHKDGDY